MRQIGVEGADLETCVSRAQQERLVITRKGKPVALLVGIEGMDPEQVELGSSERFWKLIVERRRQRTMSRAELEERLKGRK
jgi:antitoxin (DNA-binding transcriptional repressor) of toxin-antitoxin stability system